MDVLYVANRHEYGDPELGPAFEHFAFYETMVRLGWNVLYLDPGGYARRHGRRALNRRIRELVDGRKPHLFFSVLWGNEIDRKTVRRITRETETTTLNWFCDDEFRFESFSRFWAGEFDAVVTTALNAPEKYEHHGFGNALLSQWGFNPFVHRPLDLAQRCDVAFIGRPISDRVAYIRHLREAGVRVDAWGPGWPTGRASQEETVRILNQSRINLNFSGLSTAPLPSWSRFVMNSRLHRAIKRLPGSRVLKDLGRRALGSPPSQAPRAGSSTKPRGIQARIFEVTGCGAFLLSEGVPGLDRYYRPGVEVATFEGPEDLLSKVRLYLQEDAARLEMSRAGLRRSLAEHTYFHRFHEILGRLSLPTAAVSDVLEGRIPLGGTEMIS